MKATAFPTATTTRPDHAQRQGTGLALQPPSPLLQPLQARLEIGAVDDPAEHEAETIANAVVHEPAIPGGAGARAGLNSFRPSAPQLQRQCDCGGTCASCREDTLRRRGTPGGSPSSHAALAPPIVHDVLRSPGQPLAHATRASMEGRFGHGFEGVRIHTDPRAAASARAIGAQAYTVGHNVVFGAGRYAPDSPAGRHLLAHELAHVVQQGRHDGVLRRAPDKYASLSIDQLRRLVRNGDKDAIEALQNRYAAMSNSQLAQYAKGSDVLAQQEYARRTVPPADAAGQGRFSRDGMQDTLAKDIKANRGTTGIKRTEPSAVTPDIDVEGGTVGAARTDIPGLESSAFIGQSKRAGGPGYNPQSKFPPQADPDTLPHTFGHAEQHIADQLEAALAKIPRDQLKGRKVWMLIEQEVCATCGQGTTNLDTAAGVLKKLSQQYPEITFEIKNQQSSSLIVLKGSQSSAVTPPAAPNVVKPSGSSGGGPRASFKSIGIGVGMTALSIGIGLLSSYLKARVDRKIAAAQIDRNQAKAQKVINDNVDTILKMMLSNPEQTLYARVFMSSAVISTIDVNTASPEPTASDSSPIIDLTGVGFTFQQLDPELSDTFQQFSGGGRHFTMVRLLVSEIPLETPPIEDLIATAKARKLPLDELRYYVLTRMTGLDQSDPNKFIESVNRWQHILDLIDQKAAPVQAPSPPPAPARPPAQAHPNPPNYKPPASSTNTLPSVQQQTGTVCPNCHTPNKSKDSWKDFSSGSNQWNFGKGPQDDEATRKFLQDWLSK